MRVPMAVSNDRAMGIVPVALEADRRSLARARSDFGSVLLALRATGRMPMPRDRVLRLG